MDICQFANAIYKMHAKRKANQRNNDRIPSVILYYYCTTLGVLEVVSPKRPDFVLASDVPHCKTNVLVFNCFYVKS